MTYDNIPSAAAGLGVSIALLRVARELGCPSIRNGGRVYADASLAEWFTDNARAVSSELRDCGERLTPQKLARLSERIAANQVARPSREDGRLAALEARVAALEAKVGEMPTA